MIKSFSIPDSNIQDFVQQVTASLAGRELGKLASLSFAGQNLTIVFSKLGKSELVYSIEAMGSGFKCVHRSEKIALTHRPLRSEIESKLSKVLESSGARVELA